tara:strand:+ start:1134 stop:1559 length:426 start_codon:yes stop_codon:yes gene_type:complete
MSDSLKTKSSIAEIKHTPRSAREVLAASIGNDPYKNLAELTEVGELLAEREGIAYQLQQEIKPLLATIASELASAHAKSNLSEARLDRMAKADPRYIAHIRGTAEAIRQREHTKNLYWAIKSELEWDRTSIAHLNSLTRME